MVVIDLFFVMLLFNHQDCYRLVRIANGPIYGLFVAAPRGVSRFQRPGKIEHSRLGNSQKDAGGMDRLSVR
jgi:hypothetical protein